MNERTFALDIGTQSVTGILLKKSDEQFTVIDYCIKEHQGRSMLDGQIHNVLSVSQVIKEVKEELEKKHGSLQNVCVAAAGRALKTTVAEATIQLHHQPITNEETIKHLELSAVQAAQQKLALTDKNNDFMNYYCVGYSVLHYKLDQEVIGSFIDQSGNEATVEIIATFLPKIVVESLLASLDRANLTMEALTLEPIAAIHVLIPPSMRRLNVALIDIGAGTSDIAITDKGTVVAYGMVSIAGDEITEAISDHYLLDFPIAEQTKRKVVHDGQAVVEDILGLETSITYENFIQEISESIDKLALALAEEIIHLNAKAPKAVMLVGGGSLTPEITQSLASKLQLPENRVAIRGLNAIQGLHKDNQTPEGPELVTPIGIAIAAKQNPIHYITIKVNNKLVRMFEMKQLTIGDCLIQAGIKLEKQYGMPGLAIIVTVNGKEMTLPGTYGGPPTIYLNGDLSNTSTIIKNGDEIIVTKGEAGKDAHYTIQQLIGEIPEPTIFFNGQSYSLKTTCYINGDTQPNHYVMQDHDQLTFHTPKTIESFLTWMNKSKDDFIHDYAVFVNDQKVHMQIGKGTVRLNDKAAKLTDELKHQDHLSISPKKEPKVSDILDQMNKPYWDTLSITFNGKPVQLKRKQLQITRGNHELEIDSLVNNQDHLKIESKALKPFIFQDIFRFVDIDLTNANGQYELYCNNKAATFYEKLKHGDQLAIKWN